ncbi:MAG TPA: nicotinate phosphoribosyltransferase [Bacteroidales bacterium]|nr:nicotinate phosphoribosyltransferase [Bacteroidales bacterium]
MHYQNPISPLYTDFYQLTMGQAYFMNKLHDQPACFDYFFRKIPYKGGFVLLSGVQDFLQALEQLAFCKEDLDFLQRMGFSDEFLEFLRRFKFRGSILGASDGDIVFPLSPILRIEGTLFECQLIETLLLNIINFQSLIATKASRVRFSAGNRILSDFGLRRAQGYGAVMASKAAIAGGFDNTSNLLAAHAFDIPAAGTMAHSFVESFESELTAFRHYAQVFPDNCILLVDTYNTLKSGVPNAIVVAKELEAKGFKLKGIRLDSGDLAYFSKKARTMLDMEGLQYVKIIVSNQLDEYVIKSLIDQGAPIDVMGVGTSMIIGRPDGALDGVYKLAWAGEKPRLKISDNVQKTTLPGKKIVYRFLDADGNFYADCIALEDEPVPQRMIHPFEAEKSLSLNDLQYKLLLKPIMENGKMIIPTQTPFQLREIGEKEFASLPEEHKRFDFPHIYKVGISEGVTNLRADLLRNYMKYS